MRIHTNQLFVRVLGTVTGLGFLALGSYALFGAEAGLADALRERASAFGVTALVGGVWAVGVSWLDADLSGVWCRSPRARRDAPPNS
jgi:hypothetical protein